MEIFDGYRNIDKPSVGVNDRSDWVMVWIRQLPASATPEWPYCPWLPGLMSNLMTVRMSYGGSSLKGVAFTTLVALNRRPSIENLASLVGALKGSGFDQGVALKNLT